MTPQEIHWHNFRLVRSRVKGMHRAQRHIAILGIRNPLWRIMSQIPDHLSLLKVSQ